VLGLLITLVMGRTCFHKIVCIMRPVMYSCLCACVHMFLALAGSWQRPDFKSTTILSCGLESGVWASRRCVSALLCARSVTVVTGMAGQRQTHVWGVTLNRDMMKHTHFDELTYAVCFNFHHTHTHHLSYHVSLCKMDVQ